MVIDVTTNPRCFGVNDIYPMACNMLDLIGKKIIKTPILEF